MRGERFWADALATGITSQELIGAASRYRQVSKKYDHDKIKFSDNWLETRSWEKYPAGAEKAKATHDEAMVFWAKKIKSGKAFGLSEKMARDCISADLVDVADVQVLLGAQWE